MFPRQRTGRPYIGSQPVTDNGGSITVDDGGTTLSVDDAGSSLTVDTAQLPSTLGQKTSANSLSVVQASDSGFLTYEQQLVEQGKVFVHSDKHSGVAASASVDHMIVTPASPTVRMWYLMVDADDSPVDVTLYEGCTVSANGTTQTCNNLNRNSAITAASAVYTGPTVTTTGTELSYHLIPTAQKSGGALHSNGAHLVLKPSEKYLLRITNNGSGPADIGVGMKISES